MNEQIKALKDQADKHRQKAKQYEAALKALQLVCEHDWKYLGHGHNYSIEVCTKCGLEEES